jgi:hypothetical protein
MSNERNAHRWAHPGTGNSLAGCNLFFDGPTAYSYGRHFPLATHWKPYRGPAAILLTTDTYSVTTAGHRSRVARAIPQSATVYEVSLCKLGVTPTPSAVLADLRTQAARAIDQALRATTRNHLYDVAERAAGVANDFAARYGLRAAGVTLPEGWADKRRACMERRNRAEVKRCARYAKERAERERIQAMNEAKRAAELPGLLAAWQAGAGAGHLPYWYRGPDLLRVNPRNPQEAETSRSVTVPMADVRRLAPYLAQLCRDCAALGKPWTPEDVRPHLGAYHVEGVSAEGVLTVGCHRFALAEVERFAALVAALPRE